MIHFNYNGKPYSLETNEHKEVVMHAGHSKLENLAFSINEKDIQLVDDPKDVKLIVEFTHGQKEKIIDSIPKLPQPNI